MTESSSASGLVWVGSVVSLAPIEGADRIESATAVCGRGGKWMGVVPKGQFPVGSLCQVYIQDALVPQTPEFAFMEKHHWRVKMARFKGAPSECLIMPQTVAGSVGDDITAKVGVTKYEKPLPMGFRTEIEGLFPSWIPKTDEINFQQAPELVDALRGKPWYATVKYDGSSTTAYKRNGHLGVCSRNYEMKPADNNVMWRLARGYELERVLPEGYAVQWETIGPGVQGNPLDLKTPDMRVFNVWDISNARYLDYIDALGKCREWGLPMVVEVAHGGSFDLDAEQLRALAEGLYPNGKQREGIVIRPLTESRVGEHHSRLSFKVINLLYKENN